MDIKKTISNVISTKKDYAITINSNVDLNELDTSDIDYLTDISIIEEENAGIPFDMHPSDYYDYGDDLDKRYKIYFSAPIAYQDKNDMRKLIRGRITRIIFNDNCFKIFEVESLN